MAVSKRKGERRRLGFWSSRGSGNYSPYLPSDWRPWWTIEIGEIDREILNSHLDLCLPCETEFNDLREVRSRMERGEATQQYAPTGKRSLQERLRMF